MEPTVVKQGRSRAGIQQRTGKEQGTDRQEARENSEEPSKEREGQGKNRQGTGKTSAVSVLSRMGGQFRGNRPRTGKDQAGNLQERQELGGAGKEREASMEEAP